MENTPNVSGPATTATSESEGRLKVDAAGMKKKAVLKKVLGRWTKGKEC